MAAATKTKVSAKKRLDAQKRQAAKTIRKLNHDTMQSQMAICREMCDVRNAIFSQQFITKTERRKEYRDWAKNDIGFSKYRADLFPRVYEMFHGHIISGRDFSPYADFRVLATLTRIVDTRLRKMLLTKYAKACSNGVYVCYETFRWTIYNAKKKASDRKMRLICHSLSVKVTIHEDLDDYDVLVEMLDSIRKTLDEKENLFVPDTNLT